MTLIRFLHVCTVQTIISAVAVYRFAISPLFPRACRFTPTCSEYAMDSLSRHGLVKGAGLALKRILRCHPFGGSGYDRVP